MKFKIGDSAQIRRHITEREVRCFANLSGDKNPLHLSKKVAEKTQFKRPIVHGLLLGAFVSELIGTKLPGKGALLINLKLQFKKPAKIGDFIVTKGVVNHASEALQLLEIVIKILRKKQILVEGLAHVRILTYDK